ncbi:MAG: phosphoenolpyruvate carboxykinase, partial [Desulfobacterales bacterium]|nr:phosphoenolpyruvate carboxykinase [Desulfobacterales bacterium]
PRYEDLQEMFRTIIDKDYPESLYNKQFSLYIDNIIGRIDLQMEAYGKNPSTPKRLFSVLEEQRKGLLDLKRHYGEIVSPAQLLEASRRG